MGLALKELITATQTGGPGVGAFSRTASNALQISAVEDASGEARVTLTQHEKETGDSLTITGGTGDWAGLNGTWTVTRYDNDKLTLDGSTFPTIVSGTAGTAGIGRITAVGSGDRLAVMFDIGPDDDNAPLRFVFHILERLWKAQQLLAPTWGIIRKALRPMKAGYEYASGARARDVGAEYRVLMKCNEDDVNDTMISNVIDESGL